MDEILFKCDCLSSLIFELIASDLKACFIYDQQARLDAHELFGPSLHPITCSCTSSLNITRSVLQCEQLSWTFVVAVRI